MITTMVTAWKSEKANSKAPNTTSDVVMESMTNFTPIRDVYFALIEKAIAK